MKSRRSSSRGRHRPLPRCSPHWRPLSRVSRIRAISARTRSSRSLSKELVLHVRTLSRSLFGDERAATGCVHGWDAHEGHHASQATRAASAQRRPGRADSRRGSHSGTGRGARGSTLSRRDGGQAIVPGVEVPGRATGIQVVGFRSPVVGFRFTRVGLTLVNPQPATNHRTLKTWIPSARQMAVQAQTVNRQPRTHPAAPLRCPGSSSLLGLWRRDRRAGERQEPASAVRHSSGWYRAPPTQCDELR